jgi:hypothetical protein
VSIKTIHGGSRPPTTPKDTTIVICLLFSKLNIYTCFDFLMAPKFSKDCLVQGYTIAYEVAYLVKTYYIPSTLVVNNHKTEV